jgi:ABC-type multidrug transport system fused ATPase/permease subunit
MQQQGKANEQLISIAHRLQTVVFYDRILCLEAGQVVEVSKHSDLYDELPDHSV